MLSKKEVFRIPYSENDRGIISFIKKIHSNKSVIEGFAIVYEIKIDDNKWVPVVRFDSPHLKHSKAIYKKVHQHLYNVAGEKRVLVFPVQDLKEALSIAQRDLNNNWEKYRNNYEIGGR